MKRTTIFLDEHVEKELQALARRRGSSTASLVREALAAYVTSASERPELSFVGAGASGRSDVAERHEELLWNEPHEPAKRPSPRPTSTIASRRKSTRRR